MTTATARPRVRAVPPAASRPGMADTLRSEFTKIRSVRSTYWTLAVLAAASMAWAVLYCVGSVMHWAQRPATFNAALASLMGLVVFGELVVMVLGALVITSEYSTGMIGTSLAVMPRRGVLYAAKALVFAAVSFAVCLVTSFAVFFTGQAILAGKHASVSLAQPGVLRAVLLSAAVVTVFGMIAYGAGAIIRHTAGAITASLGLTFLVPVLAAALPTSWYDEMMRWLPGGIALESVPSSAPPPSHAFPGWGEFAVCCGYAAVLLAVGAWLFARRDA